MHSISIYQAFHLVKKKNYDYIAGGTLVRHSDKNIHT